MRVASGLKLAFTKFIPALLMSMELQQIMVPGVHCHTQLPFMPLAVAMQHMRRDQSAPVSAWQLQGQPELCRAGLDGKLYPGMAAFEQVRCLIWLASFHPWLLLCNPHHQQLLLSEAHAVAEHAADLTNCAFAYTFGLILVDISLQCHKSTKRTVQTPVTCGPEYATLPFTTDKP